jgi:hypothetical protein
VPGGRIGAEYDHFFSVRHGSSAKNRVPLELAAGLRVGGAGRVRRLRQVRPAGRSRTQTGPLPGRPPYLIGAGRGQAAQSAGRPAPRAGDRGSAHRPGRLGNHGQTGPQGKLVTAALAVSSRSGGSAGAGEKPLLVRPKRALRRRRWRGGRPARFAQLSRSAMAAMAGSMARSRTLPKPITSAGGAAASGLPR